MNKLKTPPGQMCARQVKTVKTLFQRSPETTLTRKALTMNRLLTTILSGAILLTAGSSVAPAAEPDAGLPLKKEYQERQRRVDQWYAPARFGLFYTWGMITGSEGSWEGHEKPLRYNSVEEFEAAAKDPDAIAANMVATAKKAGALHHLHRVSQLRPLLYQLPKQGAWLQVEGDQGLLRCPGEPLPSRRNPSDRLHGVFTVFHSCGRYFVNYPTKVPGYKWKATKDYFGALVNRCHKEGIH